MAAKAARVRVDRELADEVMRVLNAKSRSEAARIAVRRFLGGSDAKKSRIARQRKREPRRAR